MANRIRPKKIRLLLLILKPTSIFDEHTRNSRLGRSTYAYITYCRIYQSLLTRVEARLRFLLRRAEANC